MNKYWISVAIMSAALVAAAGGFFLGRYTTVATAADELLEGTFQGKPIISLTTAAQIATKHIQGEVLKVELEREDGRFVYEVKILSADGRVREVELDSRDGSIIDVEDE
jgi:uncharacterized membrane protein YkoI